MSLIYVKKVKVTFKKDDELILDGQSKICNWLYNQLFDACQKDYKENDNKMKLLEGRNLRNFSTSLKKKYTFLNTVFSSVLKEPSTRLLKAYKSFFKGDTGYPKFRSWKKKWFSLVFDEPNKGWDVLNNGTQVLVSLGVIPDMPKAKGKRNPAVIGTIKEKVILRSGEQFKTFCLCKQQGIFYAVFTIERCSVEDLKQKEIISLYRKAYNLAKKECNASPPKPKFKKGTAEIPKQISWVSLDPNHKNFFVAVDHEGNSIEFKKLSMIKYWDQKIDYINSLRDVCEKKYRKRKSINGNSYTVHSPRWNRINHALELAYHRRREQIKTALYSIAHFLYCKYDLVIIGDYTPTNETAPFNRMKRSMLNQEKIGEFRRILEWIANKLGKHYLKVNEHNTTKKCCVCGHKEKKDPNVREFVCICCGNKFMRDANSGVNIAIKAGFFLDVDKYKEKLQNFTFTGEIAVGKKISIMKNNL